MDDNRLNILNDSLKMISKLQLLAAFFEDEIVYKLFLRSQVIHQLFEKNTEVDINKLELFHLQFTATLIDLLRKIKKNNEQNVTILYDEIHLNKELIKNLGDTIDTEKSFKLDQHRQSLKINQSLRKLYQVLSDDSTEYPFAKNINAFSARYADDFYYEIPAELLISLTDYTPQAVYSNAYAIIEKKLLGSLCKYDFKNEFFCGLKVGDVVLEAYRFVEVDKYFIYYPSRNVFLFFDPASISSIDQMTSVSKKAGIVHELNDRNDELQSRAEVIKTFMPPEIKSLLVENYKKLTEIDFLQNIGRIDVQANVLKAMLKTDII